MTKSSKLPYLEGFLATLPSFFMGINYTYWKTRMTWFLKSTNFDLWDVIESSLHIPTKLNNRVIVSKPRQEWDELDKRKAQINIKVVYFLYCAIDRNKYNHVCQCELTKEIWRLLKITHERAIQFKKKKSLKLIYFLIVMNCFPWMIMKPLLRYLQGSLILSMVFKL